MRKKLTKKEQIELDQKYYQEEGWSRAQAWQLAYCDYMEPREELDGGGYWIDCKTCNTDKTFGAADSCRRFVRQHKGHATWIKRLGAPSNQAIQNGWRGWNV